MTKRCGLVRRTAYVAILMVLAAAPDVMAADETLDERLQKLEQNAAEQTETLERTIAQQQDEIDELRDTLDREAEKAAQEAERQARWLPAVSLGEISDMVQIHGFGGEAYGQTFGRDDPNPFLTGKDGGQWENITGGVIIDARPVDRLQIFLQVFSGEEVEEGGDVSLDRAFAEFKVWDALKLRGGRLPHPIGIYSEVFDIGTLRPFFDLPQGTYGSSGVTAELYDGFGITGDIAASDDWGIRYDVYGGQLDLDPAEVFDDFNCENTGGCVEEEDDIDDVMGGRLLLTTPVDGLTLGAAGWSQIGKSVTHSAWGFQGEYMSDWITLRSEYYRFKEEGEHWKDTVYVETSLRPFLALEEPGFLERVELAGRFDWADVHVNGSRSGPSRLTKHRELAAGVNYWLVPSYLVVKLAYHNVRGNLFAHDEEAVEDGEKPKQTTHLVSAGVQFSF